MHGGQAFAAGGAKLLSPTTTSFRDAAAGIVDALGRELALTGFADVARNADGEFPA
jgi:hypothetical protein